MRLPLSLVSAAFFVATPVLMATGLPVTAQDLSVATAPARTLSVSGEGEIKVAPDLAIVTLSVRTEGVAEAEVMDEASGRTAAILAALSGLGIQEADIQTGRVRLVPRYAQNLMGAVDYSKIEGFSAINSIRVNVKDINAVSDVLVASIGAGANAVDGIGFGLQDDDAARDAARRAAVAEAMRLAALYADAAQVGLGPVMKIEDGGGYGGFAAPVSEPMMETSSLRSAPAVSVPVAPGELTITANVNMVFELID